MQTGATALYVAAQEGHVKVVEKLLKGNADIDVRSKVRNAL